MTETSGPALLHPGNVRIRDDGVATLLGARCDRCALVVFPAMPVCPRCRTATMHEAELGRDATLYSHAIAHVAPQGFTAPYYQAFVRLAEGPLAFTLIGRDVPVREGVLRDGAAMSLVIEPLADTPEKRRWLTYKYIPRESDA